MITFKAKTKTGEIIKSAITDFNFPAGEAFIKVEPQRELEPIEIAIIQPDPDSMHSDLFALAMWSNFLEKHDTSIERVLVMPYFPGARADRISEGVREPFGLEVYTDFINSLALDQVIVFDPHSQKTPEMLHAWNNLFFVYPQELFNQPSVSPIFAPYTGIIAPDKGATMRASAVARTLDLPVYTATKVRNPETGKLSSFEIDLPEDLENEKFLIVDDICDGGGTFLGLANVTDLGPEQLDLYVSHGVFSKNALTTLPRVFNTIFTTNSYNPGRNLAEWYFNEKEGHVLEHHFTRLDVIHLLLEKVLNP